MRFAEQMQSREVRQNLAEVLSEAEGKGIATPIGRLSRISGVIVSSAAANFLQALGEATSIGDLVDALATHKEVTDEFFVAPSLIAPLLIAVEERQKSGHMTLLEFPKAQPLHGPGGEVLGVSFGDHPIIRDGNITISTRDDTTTLRGWIELADPAYRLTIELNNDQVVDTVVADGDVLDIRRFEVLGAIDLTRTKIRVEKTN